ncbi:hypothetical protein AM493_00520 [Flavobacterium akiainvivens]|uniref:Fis family transcriptional regulator n=1 Tax=Flavobacterium akiainvivens TaxID=1202724 RepID=A0A0M8M719_9FLAO|nr:UPF0175 family protein [Flavobacterium akiainvivens]KOS04693.1 hypothetical protein AM493_00520 [Flavobacterium akiainvivens]SFQ64947.1 Predicted antitoxin, contains HTH domain [Flavobacterium akiainvivens]
MNTQTISLELPGDILLALNESEPDFKQRLKATLAMQLYKLQKLTIGKASQLAGMPRLEFETLLSENNISISNITEEDIDSDIQKLL